MLILKSLITLFFILIDLPSTVLLEGEFITSGGSMEVYYFHVPSDIYDQLESSSPNDRKIDLLKYGLNSQDIFKNYYSVDCSNELLYGIDARDKVNTEGVDLSSVTIIRELRRSRNCYVGILNNKLIELLNRREYNCLNFDIDVKFQDLGGDSVETYYIIGNNSLDELNKEVLRIKALYMQLELNDIMNNFDSKHKQYTQFVKQNVIDNEDSVFFVHYK